MINRRHAFVAVTAVLLSAVTITPARAGCSSGFLANALCEAGVIDRRTANAVDAAHAAAGRPLDHLANQAAGAAANSIAPGSGPSVTQALEFRDMYNRGQVAGGPPPGAVLRAPPPVVMGNICATSAGRYPGPFNPVGSPCQAMTPWGLTGGVVTR